MKTGSENIDQLFKEKLSNFEADVNPSAWENIEKGLQTPSGNIADRSIRANRIPGKLKLKNVISFLLLSGAAILAVLYFSNKKSGTTSTSGGVKTLQQVPVPTIQNSDQKITSPAVAQQKKAETVPAAEKQNRITENRKAVAGQTVISNAAHTKENVSIVPAATVVTDSKDKTVHQDKNSSVKNNTQSSVNQAPSKAIENNHDVNPGNSSGEDLSTVQTDNNSPVEADNGFAFYPPDAFTPNGDGVNDFYTPQGLNFKEYEILIYDQIGAEVFNSGDITNSWDGKLRNGKEASSGIYLYVINVKDLSGKSHLLKGKITLKR